MKHRVKRIGVLVLALYLVGSMSLVAGATQIDSPELESAQEILQNQEAYVVGYTPDHAPFSYLSSGGEVAGMAIDMMNYIAETAGIEVTYVSLADGTDVDISLSILESDQREDISTRSVPYFNFQMMLTGEGQNFGMQNARIGHLNYSAISDEMIEAGLPGCSAFTYSSYADLESALKNGGLDYILTSSLVVTQTNALSQSLGAYSITTELSLDLMLKYNDTLPQETMDAFNTVIDALDDQTKYSITINAAVVAAADEMTTADFIYQNRIEITCVILAIATLIMAIVHYSRATKRKLLIQTLHVDELTGLMTERRFFEVVTARLRKTTAPYYIISIDIDNFKYINENYSYEKGTKTIASFATMLQSSFANAECIARPFADNFLIFTKVAPRGSNICGREVCRHCMDFCVNDILGTDYKLMTSTGVYKIEDRTLPLSYMIDCANIARRRGKDAYARTEIIFTPAIEDELKTKNDIVASMEQAIQNREFKMHYQPKINFKTNQIIGAEALVRWYTPNGNQVYPNQIIYLFEQNGFITRLDFYVLNEVCDFLRRHPEMPKISVNLSGFSFLDPGLVKSIMSILNKHKVSPSCIEIEITESAIVNEFEIIVKKIDELRACGFTVSMDDFGAGMSSLHRLKDISIDVLKIDRGFLGSDTLSKKGVSIIDSIIQMSRRIEVTTVAEGVETAEQVNLLTELNCNVAQGYYYSKPLDEDTFINFTSTQRPNTSAG